MTYNMTAFEQSNNVLDVFISINNITGNLMALLTLVSIFIIMMIILLRNNPPTESIVAASATTTVFALVFLAINVVSVQFVIAPATIFAIGAVALYLNRP